MADLKRKIESLKSENMTLLTSNQSLKGRLESMKYELQSKPQDDDLLLQNQQLETSMNNLRDYYEREIENKDYQLRSKEQEVESLLNEVN